MTKAADQWDPRFRIHKKTESGWEILIVGYQFDSTGRFHTFADHNHAKNFCKYLFSQSKAHQPNHLTSRNLVCEFENDGKPKSNSLESPKDQMLDFLSRRFPSRDAHKSLMDDGAYVEFAIKKPDGHFIGTMVRPGEIEGSVGIHVGFLEDIGGTENDINIIERMITSSDSITFFSDQEMPDETTMMADRLVQTLVSSKLGSDVIMSVSHRDQLDHNQTYHIHRLLNIPEDNLEGISM